MRTEEFDYELPADAIAQVPLAQRDRARLLRVADLSDHRVADLPVLLRAGDVVVVNRTRVRAARLRAVRATGGAVEVLLLAVRADGTWDALVRPARRLSAGERLTVAPDLVAELVSDPLQGRARLLLETTGAEPAEEVVARVGEVPLPPYIHGPLGDPERYQTIFADPVGSAAAPTAGLHFTPGLVRRLDAAGIAIAELELRVGLDTFRPIVTDEIADHELHHEWCRLGAEAASTINAARARGGRVVAIGTTVTRTLESFADEAGILQTGEMATGLYITPGYRFRAVDAIMTNFHVPRSSLLVMVAAFIGDRWREAYRAALDRGYRFLSFGDAMLLEQP